MRSRGASVPAASTMPSSAGIRTGRRVASASQRQPDADHTIVNDVYLQDADSDAAPVQLTQTTHACAQPRVSSDGALVAFTATDVPHFPGDGRAGGRTGRR